MSQADRDAYNSNRREARAEMSQEARDIINSKRHDARAAMSQKDLNNQTILRRLNQDDPDLERKRAYRAAYMRQWRAKKKAKKLYDAEMARIRS